MKNVIAPLTKSFFIALRLTTAAQAADAGIYRKNLASGTTALIIFNNEMQGIIKIVNYLEDFDLLF